jgi:phosphoribosylpyrophosphate synthetase
MGKVESKIEYRDGRIYLGNKDHNAEREPDNVILRGLKNGIRNELDPVTTRTLIVTLNELNGSPDPEWEDAAPEKFNQAVEQVVDLTQDTFLQPLRREFLMSMGYPQNKVIERLREFGESEYDEIDWLFLNGRHFPEPLLYKAAREAQKYGGKVAAINTVGHHGDNETRTIPPTFWRHPIGDAVMIASTQHQQGGSLGTVGNVMFTVDNPEFVSCTKRLHVVMPMFGGSRSHRIGQSRKIGREKLGAEFNAELLSGVANNILVSLRNGGVEEVDLPEMKFYSVDIHNDELPAKTFKKWGYEFVSISPAPELADAATDYLEKKEWHKQRLRFVACDHGSVKRTEVMVEAFKDKYLEKYGELPEIEIVYMDKKRKKGRVEEVSIEKIVNWKFVDGVWEKQKCDLENFNRDKDGITILVDDMVDTCGTASEDITLMRVASPKENGWLFIGTHAVLSKGVRSLDKLNVDQIFITNTLNPEGLDHRGDLTVVDVSKSIVRTIKQMVAERYSTVFGGAY